MLDKGRFIQHGLNWMYDNEMVDQTPLLNNLYGNLYSISKCVKDLELLIDKDSRKMMIYIKLSWFGKFFYKRIQNAMIFGVKERLPRFKIRVTNDYQLFESARQLLLKHALGQGSNDETSTTNTINESDINKTE